MRRRLMKDLGGTFAVRNSSVVEVQNLIDSLKPPNTIYKPAKTIKQWELLAKISQEIFDTKSWRRIEQIDATLKIICNGPKSALHVVMHFSEFAYNCYEVYCRETGFEHSSEIRFPSNSIKPVLGKCIFVTSQKHSGDTKKLINQIESQTEHIITYRNKIPKPDSISTKIYHSPLSEIDAVLAQILQQHELIDLNKIAIVVPNSAYKRQLLSRANALNIPLSGNSTKTLASHEILQFVKYIFETNTDKPFDASKRILERYLWLNKSRSPYIDKNIEDLINIVNFESNVAKIFKELAEFLKINLDDSYFETDSTSIDTAQKAFEVISNIANINDSISLDDALYLVELLSSTPIRENTIGEGIYVALPAELEGSYFDSIFVVGLIDRYFDNAKPPVTLINNDFYPQLGIDDTATMIELAKNKLSWLLNSADKLYFSSSKYGFDGRDITQPSWSTNISVDNATILGNIFNLNNINENISHLENFFSQTPNPTNTALSNYSLESISATGIENLSMCPFKFFNRHILKLKDEPSTLDPDYLSKLEAGNLVHELLENYIKKNQSPQELKQSLRERVQQLFDEGKLPTMASIQMNLNYLGSFLDTFLDLNNGKLPVKSDAEFKVAGEIRIGSTKVNVKGKIDRIDHCPDDTIRLIDYKTGNFDDKSFKDFYKFGRRLQLAIYALLLEKDYGINSLEYWYLKPDIAEISDKIISDDELANIRVLLESILDINNTSNFPARESRFSVNSNGVKEEENCSNCEFESICYIEHKTMWQSLKSDPQYSRYAKATGEFADEETE